MSEDTQPEIHVRPREDGTWDVYATDRSDETGNFDTRSEAIAAAREANGRKAVTVTDEDGNNVGSGFVGGKLRVVLLRPDGSEYGELDPPASESSGPIKQVTLTPAVESHAAEKPEVTHG